MVTVHPRTQTMQFKGEADWNVIAEVVQSVNIPVIGNGDVNSASDALNMIEATGCDGLMIGRGARGNPWIFKQVHDAVNFGRTPVRVDMPERIRVCVEHIERAVEAHGPEKGTREMRKHIAFYLKGLPNASQVRARLFIEKSSQKVIKILSSYVRTHKYHYQVGPGG
jgi:tRNA-dihydrouridine synthase B